MRLVIAGATSWSGDPPPIRVNNGSMTIKRMDELVLRYGMPPNYIYKVPTISEYVSTPGSLEIGMCKDTFRVKF